MIKYLFVLSLFFTHLACKTEVESAVEVEEVTINPTAKSILDAHKYDLFLDQGIVSFDLSLTFGNRPANSMKIVTRADGGRIRLEKSNGQTIIWRDNQLYTTSESKDWTRDRFAVFTYQYFFMLPFKVSDTGTNLSRLEQIKIDSITYNTIKLTFDQGTGDASDDWYTLHTDLKDGLLKHAGYIVTGGGTSVEEAEQSAHAISYLDYKKFLDIPISTRWKFFKYDPSNYSLGDEIGFASISNISFPEEGILFETDDSYHLVESH